MSRHRSIGSSLAQDFNFTNDGTFAVDLPNGRYAVDLILGDKGSYLRDEIGVYLEGGLVDTVTTQSGQTSGRNYTVDVLDSQLTLRLWDKGGTDFNACIEALDIAILELFGVSP